MEKFNILTALQKLIDGSSGLKQIFSKYMLEQKFTHDVKTSILSDLAILLIEERFTVEIATLCSPVLLDLLTRVSDMTKDDTISTHEWLCICLSKLIWHFPDVSRFSKLYFEKSYGFFCRFDPEDEDPPQKKAKGEKESPPLYKLVKAANLLLMYDTQTFIDLCDWSLLATFLEDPDPRTQWYAYHCIARIGNIKFHDICTILRNSINDDSFKECAIEEVGTNQLWNFNKHRPFKLHPVDRMKFLKFSKEDFTKDIVPVEGVLLCRHSDYKNIGKQDKFVYFPSVKKSLYRLALAVSSGEPVLLQGPVGCGKTSIVEHLASVTGRKSYEDLLKVQLGEHMDSKMLLGTHCCTEIPGEFVWKSGILVQAMIEGHWLLLEDIDCAPMDVISLLVPVLQSRTIVLPGHANPIKASAGFQLFVTQRLVRGCEGSYVEFKNNIGIIEKQFRKILMDSLNKEDLRKVICIKWPRLDRVCDRILEVYALFSYDMLSGKDKDETSFDQLDFYSFHDRLVSTRDLFKFCSRIAPYFDSPKKDSSVTVFQNALECFCDSIPSIGSRIVAAEKIVVKFNLPKSKAAYYCQKDKPSIQKNEDNVLIGRIFLPRNHEVLKLERDHKSVFAHTRQASALLEKVSAAVFKREPVLLVGETGTGKTSIVQYLAELTRHKLTIINMSQQSDSVDLIGGFKPVDLILAVRPVKETFFELFPEQANAEKNLKYLQHISNAIFKNKYDLAIELMIYSTDRILTHLLSRNNRSVTNMEQISAWKVLQSKLTALQFQIKKSNNTLTFKFIEGALVKAMKNGEWLLLDEINLAEAETLECLSGVLEKDDNTLFLLEKGDKEPVKRHPNFRIFACMNPATDVGKKDLPIGIRNRFTEFFVEEITEKLDLAILVQEYLKGLSLNYSVIEEIVDFYLYMKKISTEKLTDGTGHYPHYSLRTLCRALKYASSNPCHNVPRSLYEAFCLSFLSQLDSPSHLFVTSVIANRILGKSQASVLKQSIPEPRSGTCKKIKGYWIQCGEQEPQANKTYIFTKTVEKNLHDLARIVSAGRYPVLLQGETSVGKTSLIQWLAQDTGNVCLRVNNHEHTDIQEYVGTYSADETGRLVFKEGVLVTAMRKGYWIILDELNLAPTEVMEALNRVLDDNRELFISETQTVVKAHPSFMIFATQNPAGLYGGRKLLSRAFRNRFIELHFNEIPPPELEVILHERCQIPPSYSKKLVAVMHELQIRRRESGVFAGKQGYITLRDLFRWGERYQKMMDPSGSLDWMQHLAYEGYLLLAGRVRLPEEMNVIKDVIEKHLGRKIDPALLFNLSEKTPLATRHILEKILHFKLSGSFKNIVWTYGMRRLAVLVGKAIEYNEPALLIGVTGSGKTTICQIYTEIFRRSLHSVNCHMHSESSDFLGGLRPVRDPEIRKSKLFEWVDGPLIKAMQEGNFFLADEISLADDSVLERLNSVLEPDQKILLSEKSGQSVITAKSGFQFFATMNPGGDYGKKELSPALRNRFTEIWCPSSIEVLPDVISIVEHNISKNLKFKKYATSDESGFGFAIAEFLDSNPTLDIFKRMTLSIRDILTWVEFINVSQTFPTRQKMTPEVAYLHGAFLSFVDGIGLGSSAMDNEDLLLKIKSDAFSVLCEQIGNMDISNMELLLPELLEENFEKTTYIAYSADKSRFGVGPFVIKCDKFQSPVVNEDWSSQYILDSRTPKANISRLLRAMQLSKPILLEGSPGVGKTSLVSILAKASGYKLVRINLSEQTDISDLFGADLPVDGGETGEFAWRDGPLLQALKSGHWILLDELNLASQSVLEGLNACLDHRNEIFIPELGMIFQINKNVSRIFCCQNPQRQGGSRKGLPQSFLNRFTKVYLKPLEKNDMKHIATSIYSTISPGFISTMVQFNYELSINLNVKRRWGDKGFPWDFNLRDVFRWCDVTIANQIDNECDIGEYMKLIYLDRMRTIGDKEKTRNLFERIAHRSGLDIQRMNMHRNLNLNVFENCVQLGYSVLPCKGSNHGDGNMTVIPPFYFPYLESLMKCIEMNWMAILVGPSGCGKTTLVTSLAQLCGQKLQILSVNSEMDTIQLLGGFEQADSNRKIEFIAQDLQPILEKAIYKCLQPSPNFSEQTRYLKELLCHYINLRQRIFSASGSKEDDCHKKLNCLKYLIKALEPLKIESAGNVLKSSKKTVDDLIKKCTKGYVYGGRFEWVDSVLVNAAKRGHWLLIDDANFCSASVLDRLNALLEPGGVLTINEQGIVNGKLRTIVPHKDFRIILTMNPKYGEISRAMRNRGIEIYMEPVTTDLLSTEEEEEEDAIHDQNDYIYNTCVIAQAKGLVHNKLLIYLCSLHKLLNKNLPYDILSLADFVNASSLCVQMGQRHGLPELAIQESSLAVYSENFLNASLRNFALHAIENEMKDIVNLKSDFSIPITDILSSSIDYRQNHTLASIKKQACLFTVILKEFIGRYTNCPVFSESKDKCVVSLPRIYHSLMLPQDLKRFAVALRMIFDSCPIQNFHYIYIWIRFHIENIKESLNDPENNLAPVLNLILQYQDLMHKIISEPCVCNVARIVKDIFIKTGYSEITYKEIPIDFRWNQYLYQKVITLLKQEHDNADAIEHTYISFANRYNLLLLFRSLGFFNELVYKTPIPCESLSSKTEEVKKNQSFYQDSPIIALISIPQFLRALCASIIDYLEDDAMPCTDDYYWKVYDIITSYQTLHRIYLMKTEKGINHQLRLLSYHFTWLIKKVRNLYDGNNRMPPTLLKSAEFVENLLSCNNPQQRFRHRCLKWLGQPPVFSDEKSAELYKQAEQLYQSLDLTERMKCHQINLKDLKTIRTNLNCWLGSLSDIVHKVMYEKDQQVNPDAISDLQEVRIQMVETEIWIEEKDDEIMEVSKNPALTPTMSDLELALEIQLLPLWDYLFVTCEAELLCNAYLLSEQNFQNNKVRFDPELLKVCIKWGTQILGLNPVHLAHLGALQRCQSKQSFAPSIFYFLQHSRHGFSSDALLALDFGIKDKNILNVANINKEWNCNYSWTKQQPLLTHILSSIHGKSDDSSFLCHFPLGSYSEKINQLKKVQTILWKYFDKLAERKKTFRHFCGEIVVTWYNSLLTAITALGDMSLIGFNKEDVLKLFDKMKITPLVTTKDNENILIVATESVIELQEQLLLDNIPDSDLHWLVGKTYVLVGLLTSLLLLPRDHLDPGLKTLAKISSYKECISNIMLEIQMRMYINKKLCRQSLSSDWIPEHPLFKGLIDLRLEYEMKCKVAEKKVPYRPRNDEMFSKLILDAKHYIETIGSSSEILDIISKLYLIQEEESTGKDVISFNVLQRAQNFCQNLQNFVEKMKKYYAYPDMIFPFLVGVEQIIYGLSLCCHSYHMKEVVVSGNSQKLTSIHKFLKQFCEISSSKWESSSHMASSVLNCLVRFKLILSFCKDSIPNSGQMLYKLIKSAILDLINEIKIGHYSAENKLNEIKKLMFSAFQSLYEAWHIQDERIKIKKANEEQLFKQKIHVAELTDEEKMEKELKEMFPSFEEEFDGIDKCNDHQSKLNNSTALDDENGDLMQFTPEDLFEVCQLHATAISLFGGEILTNDKNLFVKEIKDPDILTPFLLRHDVISSIITSLGSRLDSFFDKNLLEGLLLKNQELQKLKVLNDNEYYDIYHDPNPFKIMKIDPVLLKLEKHVSDLLEEFPEDPNLIQIIKVTQRVRSFPVSDPFMKFIIGLELTLEATEVWEKNAHRKVSLKEEIHEITKIIIDFRSSELNLWKKGLQHVIRKQYLNSSKWWFFMFPLLHSDNTYCESEKLVIIEGLQRCLEDSPLGEFPARLSILHIFLQEFQHYSSSKINSGYADVLFNIYTYYAQFLPSVENEIKKIEKPIEKEIKDYVKIARWNDINIFAVKASVVKNHKFLLKHIKSFEDELKKPAKMVFSLPSKSDLDDVETSWFLDIGPHEYVYKQSKIKKKYFEGRKEPFFQTFPSYQKKIKKKSIQIAENFPVVGYINALNGFCGNIIEALQSVTAEGQKAVCTRSREKKQTLLNIQNKKQMLATLFKNLKAIGLSYRQGIIKKKEISILMSTPAFDILQMKILETDNSFKELLLKSSYDTNHYFYKSLAQYAQLQKCIEAPSKDLTLDVLHRIQGYGGHLLNLVTSQREDISKMCYDVDNLGSFITMLSKLYEPQHSSTNKATTVIPPQQCFNTLDVKFSNLLVILQLAAGHVEALIDCAPETCLLTEEQHSPCMDTFSLSGVLKGDTAWSNIKSAIETFSCDIKNLLSQFSNFKFSQTLVSWDDMNVFTVICESMQNIMNRLVTNVSENFEPNHGFIMQNLFSLSEKVSNTCNTYHEEKDKLFKSQVINDVIEDSHQAIIVSKLCRKLAIEILLSIQEMVLFSSSNVNIIDDTSNGNVMPEGILTEKIYGSLLEAKKCLHFEKILMIIGKLKIHVLRFTKSIHKLFPNDKSFRLLINLAPLLNQYYQLVKVYLAITMGMHRTSCKFLSILLQIFNILAVNGFCIPQELKEEAAKAGATKFEDIESGGLGEGEGTKNVSNRIETEDQLEDAFQEGQEKKQNEESNDMEIKDEEGIEMSNDFEAKVHSGDEAEDSGEEEDEKELEELEKQMGDTGNDDAEKLDDKVWGSDSENEDDLRDDDGSGGITDNTPSEMMAKDNKLKDDKENFHKEKGEQKNIPVNDENEEYEGEKPDPMIDAVVEQESEVIELPENMEISDNTEKDNIEDENIEDISELDDELNDSKAESSQEEDAENNDGNDKAQTDTEEDEGIKNNNTMDKNYADEPMDVGQEENEEVLPTGKPSAEIQALPSNFTKSSSDPVQTNDDMNWESGGQNSEEQHKEGVAEASDMPSSDPGHEGKKSSAQNREVTDTPYNPKLKPPGNKRTLDESVDEHVAKKRPVLDRKSNMPYESSHENSETAEMYEHVLEEEHGTTHAIDIATKEQADKRAVENEIQNNEEEEEIIELSSDDENEKCDRSVGESLEANQNYKPGKRGEITENEKAMDFPEGEIAQTQIASRGTESTIHTQNELWKSLSSRTYPPNRLRNVRNIDMSAMDNRPLDKEELWRFYEMQVSNLSQELCEQLRLVLEPTKMSKFKGDFRTGKRINMRKIIPYIASQFRKDKIWLRRTKPTKRQYQIMLAVDDSSSMADNNSKELAFESLAVLGNSLTLLEAGELSVVSFGERVQLLHGFQDPFSSTSGAKILDQFTFSQQKTKIAQLLAYATDAMVQARNSSQSASTSKETAQLLIIISDGRGILLEGENTVKKAVKNARDNNIFMVFLILDNPLNKDSILDITCPVIEGKEVKGLTPYMDKFPFPFYILLREITALPQILGEALRQWFELVTSVDR